MSTRKTLEKHPFKDYIPGKTEILLVGSFPGPERIWKTPWFYGSRYSQFWKIMDALYGGYISLGPLENKKKLFRLLHIGVTDIFKSCIRVRGTAADTNLIPVKLNNIPRLIQRNKAINKVFFTSSFVRKLYERHFGGKVKGVFFVTLPSPSPRYARVPIRQKIEVYRKYFPEINKADERIFRH